MVGPMVGSTVGSMVGSMVGPMVISYTLNAFFKKEFIREVPLDVEFNFSA